MGKKQVCKILYVFIAAFFLSLSVPTASISGDHLCAECVTVFAICPCPAKRVEQQLVETAGPVAVRCVYIMSSNIVSYLFLWGPCPVELKTRMNN